MHFESTDWSLEVPEGWNHESDEDCTTFTQPEAVGAFQVSSYRKEEPVTDDDLREFAGQISLDPVSIGALAGYCTRFAQDDTFWAKWWLRAGRLMIYVTYNCPVRDFQREEAEVRSMIQTLEPQYC